MITVIARIERGQARASKVRGREELNPAYLYGGPA